MIFSAPIITTRPLAAAFASLHLTIFITTVFPFFLVVKTIILLRNMSLREGKGILDCDILPHHYYDLVWDYN